MNGDVRAFVCVAPTGDAALTIASFARSLSRHEGFKWVEPQNIHITLAFLGDSDLSAIQRIDSALSRMGGRSFDVTVEGAGSFGRSDRARVLWLGVKDGARELEQLASRVSRAARSAGYDMGGANFTPHMTLARARGDARPLSPELRAALDASPRASWRVESFTLMRSELTSRGPIYTPIREYAF